jgi:hypothetical protein
MPRLPLAAVLLLAISTLCSATSPYIVPTTTLGAQTGNNTSAANSFTNQSNGNRGAGNISKVDVHTLLYPGATTKVYAHLMLWFGGSSHMNIGYSSTDPAQVKSQITDMISRGIDGVIIDWYGPNNAVDQATQLVMAEAENHPGFTFAIMVDQGAVAHDSCSGCSPQQALITQLQYIEHTYIPSPAYMTSQGQPVVTNFNIDLSYLIDWNAVNAALSTHPLFLFQNNNGFSHTLSGGSYSWVMPTITDYGMGYLSSFYDAGMSFPSEQTVGATYKGFNDTLASWGSNRIMKQQCGQTWLQTFSEINGLYNSGKPLPDLQLVTWNDYEEATEIESGIDNCLTLSATVATNALQWTIAGNENTVDHYSVYISSDGENLMSLTDSPAGIHLLNLCGFAIPAGNYQLFVEAVGKPSLANQITSAIDYAPSCIASAPAPTPVPPPAPSLSFSASPASVTIIAGEKAILTVSAGSQSGAFNNPIALSCGGLPSTLHCSFSPSTITPGSGTANSVLTISAASVVGRTLPRPSKAVPIYAGWFLPLGVAGLAFLGKVPYQRSARALAMIVVFGIGMVTVSCGGNKMGTAQNTAVAVPVSTNYSVTIQGNASSSQLSTTVNVVVQ